MIFLKLTENKVTYQSNDYIYYFLGLIVFLVLVLFSRNRKYEKLRDFKKNNNNKIDMDDLQLNINNSKELYKKLVKLCHPDKFIDEIEKEIAENLTKEIVQNKRNFKKLEELKMIAIKKLHIKFNSN